MAVRSLITARCTAVHSTERVIERLSPTLLSCALLSLSFVPFLTAAQAVDTRESAIPVESSLVLVDVIAQSGKTVLPLTTLNKEDFRVFDNGREKPIESFDVGAHYGTRPIALRVAVICNEKDWDEKGSGFVRGKGSLIRPALDRLDTAKEKYPSIRITSRPAYIASESMTKGM